jgi:hypothetical protein
VLSILPAILVKPPLKISEAKNFPVSAIFAKINVEVVMHPAMPHPKVCLGHSVLQYSVAYQKQHSPLPSGVVWECPKSKKNNQMGLISNRLRLDFSKR